MERFSLNLLVRHTLTQTYWQRCDLREAHIWIHFLSFQWMCKPEISNGVFLLSPGLQVSYCHVVPLPSASAFLLLCYLGWLYFQVEVCPSLTNGQQTIPPFLSQPEELTNALEISNIVFTSLFALEMLLKVLVYGPFGYIKNPYNIFDGIIVVIRYKPRAFFICVSFHWLAH